MIHAVVYPDDGGALELLAEALRLLGSVRTVVNTVTCLDWVNAALGRSGQRTVQLNGG